MGNQNILFLTSTCMSGVNDRYCKRKQYKMYFFCQVLLPFWFFSLIVWVGEALAWVKADAWRKSTIANEMKSVVRRVLKVKWNFLSNTGWKCSRCCWSSCQKYGRQPSFQCWTWMCTHRGKHGRAWCTYNGWTQFGSWWDCNVEAHAVFILGDALWPCGLCSVLVRFIFILSLDNCSLILVNFRDQGVIAWLCVTVGLRFFSLIFKVSVYT